MDNDNPFGTFAPEAKPEIASSTAQPAADPKPKRKYTRKAKPEAAAAKPARKYTRKPAAAAPAPTMKPALKVNAAMLTALAGLSETEMGVIARLLEMPALDLVRIGKALQKLGEA